MDQTAIFGPFFATMLLTLVVWVYMYFRRIHFINSNDLGHEDFIPARFTELSPPGVVLRVRAIAVLVREELVESHLRRFQGLLGNLQSQEP